MDAANSPRTTRDALIYDLLGDVGRLEEKIKSLPATLNNALEPTKKELRDIQSNILKQIAALPGAADKEAKRANDAVISSLGKEVGRIAQQIAGNAAEATAAKAKTEAARWQAGALLVGLAVGAIGTYLAVSGAHAINMSTARDRVAAAELRAETAEAEAKKRADEAIAEITEKSGAAVAAASASTPGQRQRQDNLQSVFLIVALVRLLRRAKARCGKSKKPKMGNSACRNGGTSLAAVPMSTDGKFHEAAKMRK